MCWIFVKRTYLRVCWRSTIDLCLMNLPKRSSFKSVLKVYTLSKILLWNKPSHFSLENACYSWCMHQTGLFSSASVVLQSKFTGELCDWHTAESTIQSTTSFDQSIWCSCARIYWFSIENVIAGCLNRKKSLYSFFIISLAAGMRRGRVGPKRTSHVGGWREHYLDKEKSGDTFWPVIT